MNLGGDGLVDATPVAIAFAQLSADLAALIKAVDGGGLDHFDDLQLIGFMRGFEQFRNQLPLVDHRLIRDGAQRGLPHVLTQPSMAKVLSSTLLLSTAEAGRRTRAAEALGERVSMLGESLAPIRPVLAAAQRAGEVTPEQANLIISALGDFDRPGYDPDDVAAGEELLTRFAHDGTARPQGSGRPGR